MLHAGAKITDWNLRSLVPMATGWRALALLPAIGILFLCLSRTSPYLFGHPHIFSDWPAPLPGQKPAGWVLACYQELAENEGVHDTCLASVCSLLQTTNPRHVLIMVDALVEEALGDIFRANGVNTFVVPSVNVHKIDRSAEPTKWQQTVGVRKRSLPMQVYSAKKFYAWTLTQFSKLLYADGTDVLFTRDATTMLADYEPFAAIHDGSPNQRRCGRSADYSKGRGYMNAGVILLRPSMTAFHELMETYFRGNFTYCGGSGGVYGDQDTMTNLALRFEREDGLPPSESLGPFTAWPFCFNYRGWRDQKKCKKDAMLLHKSSSAWPGGKGTVRRLSSLARQGTCRPDSIFRSRNPPLMPLRPVPVSAAWNYSLDYAGAPSGLTPRDYASLGL